MTQTPQPATERATLVACYQAPGGTTDFHSICDQLHADYPRDLTTGRWLVAGPAEGFYRFTWIPAH